MRQAIQVECWNCRTVFTMSAEPSTGDGPLVDVAVPCPFCNSLNKITIRADQVKTNTLYKGSGKAGKPDLSQPGALLDQVFPGVEPPETQE